MKEDYRVVKDVEEYKRNLKKFLCYLPIFQGNNSRNCESILVKGLNKDDARSTATRLTGRYVGLIEEVRY